MTKWTAAFVALVSWWTLLGHEESRVWQSNASLWGREAQVQPHNVWVQQNYIPALLEDKRPYEACDQLAYIQALFRTKDAVNETKITTAQLDAWVVDRILVLAYQDHQGLGITACRDDSILSVASR